MLNFFRILILGLLICTNIKVVNFIFSASMFYIIYMIGLTLIIIKPGYENFDFFMILPVITACSYSFSMVLAKIYAIPNAAPKNPAAHKPIPINAAASEPILSSLTKN